MPRNKEIFLPRHSRTLLQGYHFDPDAFGRFSETIARFIGTAKFLVWQTGVCAAWIILNLPHSPIQFDGSQLQLLTLCLSLQAAYAAPLILLAQNREQTRDRTEAKREHDEYLRLIAAVEYLAVELADVRRTLQAQALEGSVHTGGPGL